MNCQLKSIGRPSKKKKIPVVVCKLIILSKNVFVEHKVRCYWYFNLSLIYVQLAVNINK